MVDHTDRFRADHVDGQRHGVDARGAVSSHPWSRPGRHLAEGVQGGSRTWTAASQMACVAIFGFVERIPLNPRSTTGRGVRDHPTPCFMAIQTTSTRAIML